MSAPAVAGKARTHAGQSVAAVLAILVVAEVVAAFETSMAVQLLYTPGEFFTSDLSQLVWVVTSYSLVAALATSFVGRLGDQFGRRKILVWVLLLSALGSVISAVAPSFGILVAGRALQGVSGAVLPLAIVGGGGFLDYATWHWIFWTAAIFACVAALLVHFGIAREPKASLASAVHVDWVGGLMFGLGIAGALYGLTLSKGLGFTSPKVLLFLIGGLVLLALWVRWELRTREPGDSPSASSPWACWPPR